MPVIIKCKYCNKDLKSISIDYEGKATDFITEINKLIDEESNKCECLKLKDRTPFYEKELNRIKERWSNTNPNRVKIFTQQYLEQGFSDENTWSLDSHFAELILPRLKRFKEIAAIKIDFPLDDMIRAFELYKELEYDPWKLKDENLEIFQKGLKAFSDYFLALWW